MAAEGVELKERNRDGMDRKAGFDFGLADYLCPFDWKKSNVKRRSLARTALAACLRLALT